jgi:hypothetical protein
MRCAAMAATWTVSSAAIEPLLRARHGRRLRAMRFSDYLWGQRILFDSELPPGRIAKRLVDVPPRWPPFSTGVVGWAAFGWFSLRYYRSAWFRRAWLPVVAGRIRSHGDGSRITIRYRVPRHLLLLTAFWAYLLVRLIADSGLPSVFAILFLLISVALVLGTIGMPTTLREADDDLGEILAVVEAAAGRSA